MTLAAVAMLICAIVATAALRGDDAGGTGPRHDAASTPAARVSPETTPDPTPSESAERTAPPTVGLSDAAVAEFVPALHPATPGATEMVTLTMPDGQQRRYLYSTPANSNPEDPLPVLLAMGGWNDPPENFLDYADFDASAAGGEAVVVYPAGVAGAWAGAPYSQTSEADDISFLRAIVAQLETTLPIDRERIYAVGMSNGGGMALELACHAPDLVAGVSAVSGAFYEGIDEGCPAAPVATQIIHGTEDELLNYTGGTLHDTPYLGVEEVFRGVAERNGCAPETAEATPLGDNSDRLVLGDCAADTQHIRVNGGFHDWYLDPSTPDETWEFLSAQRVTGA